VLLHELAHVKRWNCLTQPIARLACAVLLVQPSRFGWWRGGCASNAERPARPRPEPGLQGIGLRAHLVEIAERSARDTTTTCHRHGPRSNLEGRIAAIVDVSRVAALHALCSRAFVVLACSRLSLSSRRRKLKFLPAVSAYDGQWFRIRACAPSSPPKPNKHIHLADQERSPLPRRCGVL